MGLAGRSGERDPLRALPAPVDILCVGVPFVTPYLPRERSNPLLAAFLALGIALRLWRETFPVVDGGTAILMHPFDRRFPNPTQAPYRDFFRAMRGLATNDLALVREAELQAGTDERALAAYRSGRSHHPLLPYADWTGCGPALARLGSVLIAGCRDHDAARALGFVPTHGFGAALQMAQARTDGSPRIGFLVAPPYFPLVVGRE